MNKLEAIRNHCRYIDILRLESIIEEAKVYYDISVDVEDTHLSEEARKLYHAKVNEYNEYAIFAFSMAEKQLTTVKKVKLKELLK